MVAHIDGLNERAWTERVLHAKVPAFRVLIMLVGSQEADRLAEERAGPGRCSGRLDETAGEGIAQRQRCVSGRAGCSLGFARVAVVEVVVIR